MQTVTLSSLSQKLFTSVDNRTTFANLFDGLTVDNPFVCKLLGKLLIGLSIESTEDGEKITCEVIRKPERTAKQIAASEPLNFIIETYTVV